MTILKQNKNKKKCEVEGCNEIPIWKNEDSFQYCDKHKQLLGIVRYSVNGETMYYTWNKLYAEKKETPPKTPQQPKKPIVLF